MVGEEVLKLNNLSGPMETVRSDVLFRSKI
jgi:hypothetical protein